MMLFGLACQIVGAFIVKNQIRYAESLWFGVLFAVVSSIHMARTLDRALVDPSCTAKVLTRGCSFEPFDCISGIYEHEGNGLSSAAYS